MVIKGFLILLVCVGLSHAGRTSNYLNKHNLDDKEVKEKKLATGLNEYQKPNVEDAKPTTDEAVPTTEEVIPTTEESISSTEKSLVEEEEENPETEEEEKPETEKKEKSETYKKDKPKTNEKQKTETEQKEKPKKEEEKNPEEDEEEKPKTEEEETQTEEGETKEETTTEKTFIGKKCSLTKAQVEKTYEKWCELFGKKNYPKLLEMYTQDGYIRILSDTYHVHKMEDLQKLLPALKVLETSFKISKCEDFLSSHTSYGCDPKTKTASIKGIMKTKNFDPPISGSFNVILVDEGGKSLVYSQELNIADKK